MKGKITEQDIISLMIAPIVEGIEFKRKVFYSKFSLTQIVYIKTDIEQKSRLVTSISFKGSGAIVYGLGCGTEDSEHYDFELTDEIDILKKTL